jgi:outer membrane immunogenic protein
MKKLLLSFTAITAIGAGSALAADMPVKAVYKAPPVISYYSWTGCFVGGNGGGLWVSKDYNVGGVVGGFGAVGANLGTHTASSGLGGVQIGCDYQFAGSWVIGIQADYDWSRADGSHTDLVTATWTDHSQTTSLGSVTGRLGYSWDRFLGYVRGGYAWERDNYNTYVTATGLNIATANGNTRNGYTVGIGGEFAFTNWLSGFAEYDYYDFGTKTTTFVDGVGATFGSADIRERKSVFKVGLNLRWNPSPVVARY